MKIKDKRAGLVFFSFNKHPKGYYDTLFTRLSSSARKHGLQLSRGSLKDLRFYIASDKFEVFESLTGVDLKDFDIAYFELWSKCPQQALCASVYLEAHGVPFLGPVVRRIQPDTKLGELVLLQKAGLPIPETVSSSHRQLLQWFRESPPLQFPLIIKDIEGFGGRINFLVESELQLRQIMAKYRDKTFIIQKIVPNDRDYRFLVLDNEIELVLERRGDGRSHLNNTSRGAKAALMGSKDFPRSLRKLVLKSAEILGRSEFAGVDVIIHRDTGEPYILEVNKTPEIEIGSYAEAKTKALLVYLTALSRRRKN